MPDLPTITVTNAQAARIREAYFHRYGVATNAEFTTEFRKELTRQVRAVVLAYESQKFEESVEAQRKQHQESVETELPPDPDDQDTQ